MVFTTSNTRHSGEGRNPEAAELAALYIGTSNAQPRLPITLSIKPYRVENTVGRNNQQALCRMKINSGKSSKKHALRFFSAQCAVAY